MKHKGLYYPEGIDSDSANKLTAAADAIDERLSQWVLGKIVTHDEWLYENGWLHQEVAKSTQDLFKRFYTNHVSRVWLRRMGFEGWECGLGQMLDIRDTRIACLLPYLLTAHMYNFRATKYITGFINNSCPTTWRKTWSDDYFFGVLEDVTFSEGDTIDHKEHPVYGIGKYLMGKINIISTRSNRLQDTLVQSFFFPKTELRNLSGYSLKTYLVPQNELDLFESRIEKHILIDCDDGTKSIEERYVVPDASKCREYQCDIYELLFHAWYQTIAEAFCSKRKHSFLGCAPSAKDCYCLLQYHLKQVPVEKILELNEEQIDSFLTASSVEKPGKVPDEFTDSSFVVKPPKTI